MKEHDMKRKKKEKQSDDKCNPPPTKRRRLDDSSQPVEAGAAEEGETPEGLRAVPGMNGLSVEFVKDTFYSKDDEDICSEHLHRGR